MNDNMKKEIEKTLDEAGDARMWAVSGDSYFPCEKTEDQLPPAQYVISFSENKGYFFLKKTVNLDNLIDLPDTRSEYVLKSIQNFWEKEKAFRKHGFLWKRGMSMSIVILNSLPTVLPSCVALNPTALSWS